MTRIRSIVAFLSLFVVTTAGLATGADKGALEKNLDQEYRGKNLLLNLPSASNHLRFDEDGKFIGQTQEEPWTTGGVLRVEQIHLKKNLIQVKAKRVLVIFRRSADQIHPFLMVTDREVQVDLNLASGLLDLQQDITALNRIFKSGPLDYETAQSWKPAIDLNNVDFDNWPKSVAPKLQDGIIGYLSGNRAVYVPGSVTTMPKAIGPSQQDVLFQPIDSWRTKQDIAQLQQLKRTTALGYVVNENGKPELFYIFSQIESDTNARLLIAISQQRFVPAQKGNKTVAVFIPITMTFRGP